MAIGRDQDCVVTELRNADAFKKAMRRVLRCSFYFGLTVFEDSRQKQTNLIRSGMEIILVPPGAEKTHEPSFGLGQPKVGNGRIICIQNALEIPDLPYMFWLDPREHRSFP